MPVFGVSYRGKKSILLPCIFELFWSKILFYTIVPTPVLFAYSLGHGRSPFLPFFPHFCILIYIK